MQASRPISTEDVPAPTTSSQLISDGAVTPPIPPPRRIAGVRSASGRTTIDAVSSSGDNCSSRSSHDLVKILPSSCHSQRTNDLCGSSGVEKFIDTSASESGSPVAGTKLDHLRKSSTHTSVTNPLRPNSSVSNLETLIREQKKNDEIKKLPIAEENSLFREHPMPAASAAMPSPTNELLPRARPPIVGAYTQKAIPFRSASFSQVDYSSGKYIRSALGALKASFVRSKSPPCQAAQVGIILIINYVPQNMDYLFFVVHCRYPQRTSFRQRQRA